MRREFPQKVRQDAWARCGGRCEKCRGKLFVGHYDYDHVLPDGLGGAPVLSNCMVLCDNCHDEKTHQSDRPMMAKADRGFKKHFGIKTKSGRGFPKARPQRTATTPPTKRVGYFPDANYED